MKRPKLYAGSCSYDGHMCNPLLVSDMNRVIPGRFWTNMEQREAAFAMLEAAFDAGRASVLAEQAGTTRPAEE